MVLQVHQALVVRLQQQVQVDKMLHRVQTAQVALQVHQGLAVRLQQQEHQAQAVRLQQQEHQEADGNHGTDAANIGNGIDKELNGDWYRQRQQGDGGAVNQNDAVEGNFGAQYRP